MPMRVLSLLRSLRFRVHQYHGLTPVAIGCAPLRGGKHAEMSLILMASGILPAYRIGERLADVRLFLESL